MPKIAISDASLRSLKAEQGQVDFWDENLPGFGVRVSPTSKTFVLNIDKTRRVIGKYGLLTLAEARTAAKRLMAERTLGKAAPSRITYADALQSFLEEKRKSRRANTISNYEYRLAHFSFKGQLGEITHQEAARRLAKIKTNAEHDHALSVAKTFFTWCMNHRYIDDNPCRGLSPRGTKCFQSTVKILISLII